MVSSYQEELCFISLIGLRLSLNRFYPQPDGRLQLLPVATSANEFEFGQEPDLDANTDENADSDSVFDNTVLIEKPSSEHDSHGELSTARRPTEEVRVHIGRIQVSICF